MTTPTFVKLNARISAADLSTTTNPNPTTATVINSTGNRKTIHLQLTPCHSGLPSAGTPTVITRKTDQPIIVLPRPLDKSLQLELQQELTLNLSDRQSSAQSSIDSASRRRPADKPLRDSSDYDSDTSGTGGGADDSTSDALSPVSASESISGSSITSGTGIPAIHKSKLDYGEQMRCPPKRQQKKAKRITTLEQQMPPRPPPGPCPMSRRYFHKQQQQHTPHAQSQNNRPSLYSESVPMRARNLPSSFHQCPNQPPAHSPALGLLPRVLPPLLSSGGTIGPSSSNNNTKQLSVMTDDLNASQTYPPAYKTRIIPKNPDLLNKLFDKCKTKESVCKFYVPLNLAKKFVSNGSSSGTVAAVGSALDDGWMSQEDIQQQPFLLHHDSGATMLPQLRTVAATTNPSQFLLPQLSVLGTSESERNAALLSEMVSNL